MKDLKPYEIECPRFGGQRLSLACITFDRYRGCRRRCDSLSKLMTEKTNLPKVAKKVYSKKRYKQDALFNPSMMKMAGKGLPADPKLSCPYKWCDFVAKSERGLKTHMTRTHKKKTSKSD